MKFTISEDKKSFWDEKEKFIKLYNEDVLMKDILKKCQITRPQYNKLVQECSKEGLIAPRRRKMLGEL